MWNFGGHSEVELADGAASSPRENHRVPWSGSTQVPAARVCSSLSFPWVQREFCSTLRDLVSDLSICYRPGERRAQWVGSKDGKSVPVIREDVEKVLVKFGT